MKLIKKINNNFALALDSAGEKIIVQGKGVGFNKMPYEINDLSVIEKTFYNIDTRYIELLNQIPEDIFRISVKIVEQTQIKIQKQFNPNLVFTLADHIQFSIERFKKSMIFDFPLKYDFEQMYEKEIEISKYALRLIESELHVSLPAEEIMGIAMGLVNAELNPGKKDETDDNDLLESITKIIEMNMNIKINRKSINFSRYVTHLQYMFGRLKKKQLISSENVRLYENLIYESPRANESTNKISDFLKRKKGWELSIEEKLYLILHINRLCSREDCNRKGMTSNT